MGSIEQLLVRSVRLEGQGWNVKFTQKCTNCNTPNSVNIYNVMIECGKCKQSFIMDAPILQINGGRQHGLARRSND